MPSAFKAIFGADTSKFEAGVNKVRRMSENAAARISGSFAAQFSGIVSVAGITELSRRTIDWAGHIRDAADGLGVNVEWLQKMQNGAKLVGAEIEDISKFITEMNKAREDALLKPDGKNAAALKRMGITTAEIANLSTQEFFNRITAAFKNGASTQLVNDVREVGGQSARNLIAAFSAQFASDAPFLAEELVDQLDDIGDSFTELKTRLMVDLAPAIIWVANAISKIPRWVSDAGTQMGAYGGSKGIVATAMDAARYNRLNDGAERARKAGLTKPGQTKLGFFSRDAHVPTAEEAAFMKDFEERMVTGGKAVAETEAENAKADEAIAAGREATRAARRKRENSPPLFSPAAINLDKRGTSSGRLGMTENQRLGAFGGGSEWERAGGYLGGPQLALLDVNKQVLAATREQTKLLTTIAKASQKRGSGVNF